MSAPSCLASLTLALPALLFAHIAPYSVFHLLEGVFALDEVTNELKLRPVVGKSVASGNADTEVREGILRTEGGIPPALDITKVLLSG